MKKSPAPKATKPAPKPSKPKQVEEPSGDDGLSDSALDRVFRAAAAGPKPKKKTK